MINLGIHLMEIVMAYLEETIHSQLWVCIIGIKLRLAQLTDLWARQAMEYIYSAAGFFVTLAAEKNKNKKIKQKKLKQKAQAETSSKNLMQKNSASQSTLK